MLIQWNKNNGGFLKKIVYGMKKMGASYDLQRLAVAINTDR